MKNTIFMNKRVGKAAILACLIAAFMALCLTGCGGETVRNGEPVTLAADATGAQLQEKLADENVTGVILSGSITLTEPLQITGEKTIGGTGTICAEGLEGAYIIEVAQGAQLTLGGDVVVDAAGTAGGVFVAADAVLTVQEQAAVKNASAETANVMVEGFLDVLGGTFSGAKGHNICNKGETNVAGGEVRGSGKGYAGIYNEGTLIQNGGSVIGAYNNIVSATGSKFTWNDGTNADALNNGMVIAESAQLSVTARSAKLTGADNLGIDLQGTAVIDDITLNDCFATLIRVSSTGHLTLNGGMIFNGSYHGVDNDGVMVMNGGDIMACADCGIVNTGTLEVKGGGISDNGNKGILNKLEGKATVVSSEVTLSGNRFAIGNDDKAYFELAKATLMSSTTTNIYAVGGEMNIHDIELGASSSNNIRIAGAKLTLNNVKVNGNASSGSSSMHGIILEGGSATATDLTVCNTTGAGIRNKGGVFTAKNLTLTNNAYIGIYTSDQDETGRPSTTVIENLTVSKQGYMSVSSNGTGVLEITNAVFEATPSNNIRVNGGTVKLNKVQVLGHTDAATTAHHGIYLEGGHIIANDLTISNTNGHGLRNKSGDFTGTNVTIKNVNGDAGVSNVMLADGTSGTVTLNNVVFSNVKSKNIVNEAGTTIVNGSYLAAAPGSNIKITGGAVSLNGVTVAGNVPGLTGTYHAIILENGYGALYMNDVTISDAKNAGIRNKTGVVNGTDVTIKDCGTAAVDNGQDKNRGLKGITRIEGLTTENCGNNNLIADAGEIHVTDGNLGASPSNSVKTSGTGLITLTNAVVDGSTNSYGVIAEGGNIELTDVTIRNTKTAGIRVNKESGSVIGTNVIIENTGTHGLFVDKGSVVIDGLTTRNIGERNIQVGANENKNEGITANGGTVRVSNATLCKTEKQHSVVAYGENQGTMLELVDVVLEGSGNGGGSRHVLLAEGGNMKLTNVTVKNAHNSALRVNRAASTVEAENLTIEGGNYGISASAGKVTVKNLTGKATNRNIAAEGAVIVVDGATLGTTTTHNVKINKGTLNLKGVVMEGSSGRGIMIEPGASDGQPVVNLEKVTISNTKSRALENRGGIVTAVDLSVYSSKDSAIQNQLHKDGKTAGTVTVTNFTCSDITRSINNDAGTVTVIGGTLGTTSGHNVKAAAGTVNLTNVTIEGTTSNSGVMAEGGNVNLTDVTIQNTAVSGVRVNRAASTVTINNLTTQGIKESGIFASAGTVNVTTYIASGNFRNIDVSGAAVSVTNASLGATTSHNVKTAGGSLVLTNAAIEGSSTYGLICEGGTVTAKDLTVKNTASAALRVNKANGSVTVTNLKVENCANSIKSSAGSMVVYTMNANTTGVNVIAEGAAITLNDATLTNAGTANVVEHFSGALNLGNVEVGAAGEGFSQIYNAADNLNLSGKIGGNILNDKPVAVNVAAPLSADTAIVIDWTEGNAPAGTAIAFAEGTVEAGRNCFTLGQIQSLTKELIFTGNTGVLENLADYVAQVGENKYESLVEALTDMNSRTGDVTLTILADCAAAEPIVVPAGMNLTIQGGESIVALDATVKVSEGATLTIGENVNITSVDATAGGSITYAGNTATAESPLTVIVKGEPHEVALTLAENSTATADIFSLVDANGNAYGSLLEDGKIKVYTKDVTDEATLLAAINNAPDNKRGYILVAADVTLSTTLNFPANKILTVMDDGKDVRTITRTDAKVDMMVIPTGANITIKSSDNSARKLILDGNGVGNNGLAMVEVAGGSANIYNINIVNANKNYNLLCSGGILNVASVELGKNYEVSSVYVSGGQVSLTDVIVGDAGSNSIRAQGGQIALHNVTVNGHTRSGTLHNIMIDGGAVTSTGKLTLQNSKASGLRVSKGSFVGETVDIINPAANGVQVSGGTLQITNGGSIQNPGRGVDSTGGTVEITGMTIGKNKSSHNVKTTAGSVKLTNVTIEGTTSNNAVMAEGGNVELNNVTIRNAAGSAIRANKASSTVTVNGLTVEGCATGISSDKATIIVDTMTMSVKGVAVTMGSGTVTVKNATLTTTGTGNVVEHKGGTMTLENVTAATIYNKAANLNISGKIVGAINNDAAVAVNATGALTNGAAVVIDWTAGNAPADTAIAFASAEDMAASKACITLGAIQSAANKVLKYADAKAVLVDYTIVSTADELKNALAADSDFAAIKVAAGAEIAVSELTVGAKEVTIIGLEGSVIKYSGSTKDANLLNLSSGGKLTLDGVTLDCNNTGKVMIEAGETVVMKNTAIRNSKGCSNRSVDVNGGNLVIEGNLNLSNVNWALCVQNGGRITSKPGSKVIINGATFGAVLHSANSYTQLNSLECSGIVNCSVYVDNADGEMVIDHAVLAANSGKNQKCVNLIKGKLTLNNTTILGATQYGIHLGNTTSKLYGSNIQVEATSNTPLNVDNGEVNISNFSTVNLKSSHSIKAINTASVTINGANLGVSNSNMIRLEGKSTVTLTGTCILNGNKSNHGIAFGAGQTVNISGDFTTMNIAGNGIESWGGTLNVSGKLNTNIFFNTSGARVLNVTGALAEGSNLTVDWSTVPEGTAIQFPSADALNASKGFITLGAVQAEAYELTYGETTATLTAKVSASGLEPEVEPTEEQ